MRPLLLTSGFTSSATAVCSLGMATYTGDALPLLLPVLLPPANVAGGEGSSLVVGAAPGVGATGNEAELVDCRVAAAAAVVVVVLMRGANTVERNASTEFSDTPSLHVR